MTDENSKKTIIVIGDWFIDKNWLVAKHRTYSSSHTGEVHYLSKHTKPSSRMLNLCGASEVLEVLCSYYNKDNNNKDNSYQLIGYGAWNPLDDDIVPCILCLDRGNEVINKYLSPFTIKGPLGIIKGKDNKRYCPYYKNQKCKYPINLIVNLAKKESVSTNMVVRKYEGSGSGKPHLLSRTDWQLQISNDDLNYKAFDELKNKNVIAVIIEDHGKGVINNTSITKLIKAINKPKNDIKYYIRTKIDNPSWLQILGKKKIKIRLKVIDHELAFHKKGRRRWCYGKVLGRASLELLGELTGDSVWTHSNIIKQKRYEKENTDCAAVLFDDNTVIAKDNDKCYNLYRPPGSKQLINIGRTTTFFNALVAQDLDGKKNDFGTQCYKALQCAYGWSKNSSNEWNAEQPCFYAEYKTALDNLKETDASSIPIAEESYKNLWGAWNKSSEELGILNKENKECLELWRGEGTIKKYICVGGPKRDAINSLISSIAQFNQNAAPDYPFNCLLVASPGWGKSFLAKCIAKHFDMNYLEFSLSQMASNKDLINCFDTICSVQNRTGKKALIFLDEINCEIEGHSAMGMLLSPIWEGSFVRDGKTYKLSPAVWIFASTEPISKFEELNKGSDFISRLNGPIIEIDALFSRSKKDQLIPILKKLKETLILDPDTNPNQQKVKKIVKKITKMLPGYIKTEQVYFGVSLLNSMWGPISKVQQEVLQLFNDLLPVNGFRSLEFFVSKFSNIQRGEVLCSNVPVYDDFKELMRHVVLPQSWNKRPEDNNHLIEINTIVN